MYAYIEGKIVQKEPAFVIIDVGGVGYEIRISLNTYTAIKNDDHTRLHTFLQVKEDAHLLYGFSKISEKETFLSLISISGVGPGTALMILSSLSPGELQNAIVNEQVKVIQSVKGIGAKTAQRIILELKDKMIKSGAEIKSDIFSTDSYNTIKEEALSALTTLGISKAVAERSIKTIIKRSGPHITLEELIKQALKAS